MRKVEAEELMGQAEREQRKPGKMSVMEEKNMTNCQEQRGLHFFDALPKISPSLYFNSSLFGIRGLLA